MCDSKHASSFGQKIRSFSCPISSTEACVRTTRWRIWSEGDRKVLRKQKKKAVNLLLIIQKYIQKNPLVLQLTLELTQCR